MDASPRVRSVNVGRPRDVEWQGRLVRTAIFKAPVDGRRRVEGVNVAGDDQGDRGVHGGPTKAVYVYAVEDYHWWSDELGRPVGPAGFGDNLTTEGIVLTAAVVGERWRVGTATLRVTEPRIPCYKLGIRMGDRRFPPRFAEAGRPGTYLAIDEPGDVGAGDTVTVLDRPEHGVTVGDVERAYHGDRARVPRLLDAPDLSDGWRAWAHKVVEAAGRRRG
jgi:MOSC domain-containing protein YiiM